VQVNSLGLTESQPENNVQRIVLEMLGVTLSRDAGPGPCSCPRGTRRSACRGRGTSSGRCACSRCWRFETDLLEHEDLFTGSVVVERRVAELVRDIRARSTGCRTWAAPSLRWSPAT
jgi:(2R)-ethylmalonyl-CoA mutase